MRSRGVRSQECERTPQASERSAERAKMPNAECRARENAESLVDAADGVLATFFLVCRAVVGPVCGGRSSRPSIVVTIVEEMV